MAVLPLDASIQTVDDELGTLVAADGAPDAFGFVLGLRVDAGALRPGALDVPAAIRVVDEVVLVRQVFHGWPLFMRFR